MPKGNDADAAAKELSARLGGEELNAETLIANNAAKWPRELRAANSRSIDYDATEALDEKKVEALLAKDHKDHVLQRYAVRGRYIVTVSAPEQRDGELGAAEKHAFPLSDVTGDKPVGRRAARS